MLASEPTKDRTDGDRIDRLIAEHRPGYGLARPFYHDPDIFERDMARVFFRHWHCLAHESVIPNVHDFELFKLETTISDLYYGFHQHRYTCPGSQ